MDATIVPKMQKHYPVLLKEIISVISPQHGGTFIDCTFGQGGYSKKILDFENTNVIGLDRDKESEKIVENTLDENEMSFSQEALASSEATNELSDGLKEFGVDSEGPDLFNSSSEDRSSDLLSSNEDQDEDDDLEIPAFLRRQKN